MCTQPSCPLTPASHVLSVSSLHCNAAVSQLCVQTLEGHWPGCLGLHPYLPCCSISLRSIFLLLCCCCLIRASHAACVTEIGFSPADIPAHAIFQQFKERPALCQQQSCPTLFAQTCPSSVAQNLIIAMQSCATPAERLLLRLKTLAIYAATLSAKTVLHPVLSCTLPSHAAAQAGPSERSCLTQAAQEVSSNPPSVGAPLGGCMPNQAIATWGALPDTACPVSLLLRRISAALSATITTDAPVWPPAHHQTLHDPAYTFSLQPRPSSHETHICAAGRRAACAAEFSSKAVLKHVMGHASCTATSWSHYPHVQDTSRKTA